MDTDSVTERLLADGDVKSEPKASEEKDSVVQERREEKKADAKTEETPRKKEKMEEGMEGMEGMKPIEPIEPIKPIEPIEPTEPTEPIKTVDTLEKLQAMLTPSAEPELVENKEQRYFMRPKGRGEFIEINNVPKERRKTRRRRDDESLRQPSSLPCSTSPPPTTLPHRLLRLFHIVQGVSAGYIMLHHQSAWFSPNRLFLCVNGTSATTSGRTTFVLLSISLIGEGLIYMHSDKTNARQMTRWNVTCYFLALLSNLFQAPTSAMIQTQPQSKWCQTDAIVDSALANSILQWKIYSILQSLFVLVSWICATIAIFRMFNGKEEAKTM